MVQVQVSYGLSSFFLSYVFLYFCGFFHIVPLLILIIFYKVSPEVTHFDKALHADNLTSWSAKMLSQCYLPVTKGHNWHIDYLSVILFCHGWVACTWYAFAPSSWLWCLPLLLCVLLGLALWSPILPYVHFHHIFRRCFECKSVFCFTCLPQCIQKQITQGNYTTHDGSGLCHIWHLLEWGEEKQVFVHHGNFSFIQLNYLIKSAIDIAKVSFIT